MLLRALVREALPSLDRILCAHDIDLSLITLHWFITLFAGVLHTRLLLRLWDLFFYEGILSFPHVRLSLRLSLSLSLFASKVRRAPKFCKSAIQFRLQIESLLYSVPKLESCYTVLVLIEALTRHSIAPLIKSSYLSSRNA